MFLPSVSISESYESAGVALTEVGGCSHVPPSPQPWPELANIHTYIQSLRKQPIFLYGITASAPSSPHPTKISGMLSQDRMSPAPLPPGTGENFYPVKAWEGRGLGRVVLQQQGACVGWEEAGWRPVDIQI